MLLLSEPCEEVIILDFTLLGWSAFKNILFSTIFISIPEYFFLVMFTLILVGEFDYWKEDECKKLINKFDYVRVFLPTITTALLANILESIKLSNAYDLIPAIVLYIIIVATNDITGDANAIKWMLKVFIFLSLGYLIIGISEFLYLPFIVYGTNFTPNEITSNLYLYFALSIPSRIIQYSILLYFVSAKRTLLKGRVFKIIFSNNVLSVIFSIFVVLHILFLWIMFKTILYDNILLNFSYFTKLCVILGILLFPIINIVGFISCIYFIKNKEMEKKKISHDKLNSLQIEIQAFKEHGNYEIAQWKLNDTSVRIKSIINNLYPDNDKKV